MRCVLQRVSSAEVRVAGEVVGAIARGLLVLVGIEHEDHASEVKQAADRLTSIRLFEDERGRMNLGPSDVGAEFLLVSQFTLAGEPLRKGRRPSFDDAALPAQAEILFSTLVGELKARGFRVATGRFGASMEVSLVNAGPVTFVLDVRGPKAAASTRAGLERS